MEKFQNRLTLQYVDFWGRRVFKTVSGLSCVDVEGALYTLTDEGEPDCPINRKTDDFYREDGEPAAQKVSK